MPPHDSSKPSKSKSNEMSQGPGIMKSHHLTGILALCAITPGLVVTIFMLFDWGFRVFVTPSAWTWMFTVGQMCETIHVIVMLIYIGKMDAQHRKHISSSHWWVVIPISIWHVAFGWFVAVAFLHFWDKNSNESGFSAPCDNPINQSAQDLCNDWKNIQLLFLFFYISHISGNWIRMKETMAPKLAHQEVVFNNQLLKDAQYALGKKSNKQQQQSSTGYGNMHYVPAGSNAGQTEANQGAKMYPRMQLSHGNPNGNSGFVGASLM